MYSRRRPSRIFNAEEARDELIRITCGYWDYVKNVWEERDRAANLQLGKAAFQHAKREARRLIGDYGLTQNDILEHRTCNDVIAYAGWPLDVHAPDGPEAWMPMPGYYVCSLEPASEAWVDYSAGNVVNGWSRQIGNTPNMGRSARGAPMPQWVELSFEQPVVANTVHVAFITDLNCIHLAKSEATDTEPAALAGASDYEIHIHDGVDWRVAVQEEGNIQRWRRHRFDTATIEKLRLVVKRAAHMDSAQVYELCVYHE